MMRKLCLNIIQISPDPACPLLQGEERNRVFLHFVAILLKMKR